MTGRQVSAAELLAAWMDPAATGVTEDLERDMRVVHLPTGDLECPLDEIRATR